jgi:uncharacterized glyoxalase superfamily metalloenzyme YdcJ
MSTTSKNNILKAAVIILLLANIGMLVFFINSKGDRHVRNNGGRDAMAKEFLQKEIGFTPQQLQLYDTLSKQHREKIKAFFDEFRSSKENSLKELGNKSFSDSAIALSIEKSANMQKEMEKNMLYHFKSIRALCTPQQMPKFDSLFYKMVIRKKPENKK